MDRAITGYHQDDEGDWVAELDCGHGQHVRHKPPFQLRPWVVEEAGRNERLGTPLNCPLCDRAELPDGLHFVRRSKEWDETTVPGGLLRNHRLARRTWGQLAVHEGRLRFTARTTPEIDTVVKQGSPQVIPPEVEHCVELQGPVSFSIDFLSVDPPETPARTSAEERAAHEPEGGDSACWAHLVCPECGAVMDEDDPDTHRCDA